MCKIKTNERLLIDHDAETFLLHISNGSVRTLINYMEKIKILDMPITYDLANKLCSNISFHYFEEYTRFILSSDSHINDAIRILFVLNDQGYSVVDILDNYFLFVKITALYPEIIKYKITALICKYITIFHNIHEHDIELALFTNNLINICMEEAHNM